MTERTYLELEDFLGRELRDEEEGSVPHLNRFPEHLLREARKLPPLFRREFLRFLIEPGSRKEIKNFDEDIFDKNKDPATWHRGGFVIPDFKAQGMLSLSVEEILAPLARAPHEPWLRFSPNATDWRRYDWFSGAPGLQRDELDYRSVVPPHVTRLLPPSPPIPPAQTEPVADIALATRRWMATRIAQEFRRLTPREEIGDEQEFRKRGVMAPSTKEELFQRFGFTGSLSVDAEIAIKALLAESRLPLSPDDVPGFRGPDEWYAVGVPD